MQPLSISEHSNSTQKGAEKTHPKFSSLELFGASKEIFIEHENLLYRLRITKQGKLILNK